MARIRRAARPRAQRRASPTYDLDPLSVVVGVDPGKTTAIVSVRDGVMLGHALVDTGQEDAVDAMTMLFASLDMMRPDAIVVERQFLNPRTCALEISALAYAHIRGCRVIRHTPADLHRVTRPAMRTHKANKEASMAMARRVWGDDAERIEAGIAGTRKHDVAEAFLMALLYTGKLLRFLGAFVIEES